MLGSEVPNAFQVTWMQERQKIAGRREDGMCGICQQRLVGKSMVQLWDIFQKQLVEEFLLMNMSQGENDGLIRKPGITMEERLALAQKAANERVSGDVVSGPSTIASSSNLVKPIKISECHDFSWSLNLWAIETQKLSKIVLALVLSYLYFGIHLLAYRDGKRSAIDAAYMLSATLTTVGYGDLAPVDQETRAVAIVVIPYGIVVLGFVLTWKRAYTRSQPPPKSTEQLKTALTEKVVMAKDAALTMRAERTSTNIDKTTKPSLDPEDGRQLNFVEILPEEKDTKKINDDEYAPLPDISHFNLILGACRVRLWWDALHFFFATFWGKIFKMSLKLFAVASTGALFIKLYPYESESGVDTWIDAFYFSVVTSTGVGYGDITPTSKVGRVYFTVYMLVATNVVADILGGVVKLYVEDWVGEKINKQIITSTIWVHKSDLNRNGDCTEADYVSCAIIRRLSFMFLFNFDSQMH